MHFKFRKKSFICMGGTRSGVATKTLFVVWIEKVALVL